MPNLPAAREAFIEMAQAIELFSINEVANDYENTLSRWIVDVANGNMSGRTLRSQMRDLILEKSEEVYTEGMREGGIPDDELALDDDDKATIRDWVLGQVEHISDFADAAETVHELTGDERTAARDAMLDRVGYWVDNLRSLGGLGLASAKKNMMVEWEFGDTQHCDTCASLNGKRKRIKWFIDNGYIPQERGSDTLDCGGWNCQCRLKNDDGGTILPA